jgi:hypothetical protein
LTPIGHAARKVGFRIEFTNGGRLFFMGQPNFYQFRITLQKAAGGKDRLLPSVIENKV